MNDHPWLRRRRLLVNQKLQIRLLLLFLLQGSLLLALLGVLVHSHVQNTADVAARVPIDNALAVVTLQNELIDNVHGFHTRSLGLMAATVTLLVVFGLLASHKIAGPVINLDRFLNGLTDGDYTRRITFRHDDNLDGFARHVNEVAEAIDNRRTRSRTIAAEMAARARDLDPGPAANREFLAETERLVIQYKQAL